MAQIEGMHGRRDRADTLTERHGARAARPAQAFKKIYVQSSAKFCTAAPMGGKPFQSALSPYRDFIRQMRRRGKSWKQIAAQIRQQGTDCTAQGISDWFRRQSTKQVESNFSAVEEPTQRKPRVSESNVSVPKSKWVFDQLDPCPQSMNDPDLNKMFNEVINQTRKIIPFPVPEPSAPHPFNKREPRTVWDTLTWEQKQDFREGKTSCYKR